MLNKESLYSLFDSVLEKAKYFTAISLTSTEEGLTRFANSQIHQNVVKNNSFATIAVHSGKKIAQVGTNCLDLQSLLEALKDAENKIDFLPDGDFEYPQISSPEKIEHIGTNLDLATEFSIENRAQKIKDALTVIPEGFTASGSLTLTSLTLMIVNSKGIKRTSENNSVTYNIVVTHESNASGFAEVCTNKIDDLDISKLTHDALKTAKDSIDAITIEPGYYDIIMMPHAASTFTSFLSFMGLDPKAHYDGYSFLKNKLGEKVFSDSITIRDDWRNPEGLQIPFDFEGFPRKSLNMIENGVLKSIPYNSKYSTLMNEENTGHSVGYSDQGAFPLNLVMSGGDSSVEEMIKNTERGLLVTRFNYSNVVNPIEGLLTGLTRDGLFLIENGEIKHPVKNMRFTDSISNVFNNTVSISKEATPVKSFFLGNAMVPAIKVVNFHITGKTS